MNSVQFQKTITLLREKNIPITEERMKYIIEIYREKGGSTTDYESFGRLMLRSVNFLRAYCDTNEIGKYRMLFNSALIRLNDNGNFSDDQMVLFIEMAKKYIFGNLSNNDSWDLLDEIENLFFSIEESKILDMKEVLDYICSQYNLEDRVLLRFIVSSLQYADKDKNQILDILREAMSKDMKNRLLFVKEIVNNGCADVIIQSSVNGNDELVEKVSDFNSKSIDYINVSLNEINNLSKKL